MNRVYHFGYSNQDASEHITSLMKDENVLLIDTRLKPYSWRSEWQGNTLKSKYGERYRQAGHCLGNINYQGGDIKIVDLDRGIKGLMMYINQGHDLILLCQCSHNGCHRYVILGALRNEMPQVEIRTMLVDENCHRSEIVRLLTEQVHVDVIHWQPDEQEAVLAAKTDELPIETAECPDDDPSATARHCIVCHNLATLKSPSGRPEGMYCEQHGYCPRCKSSIEEFVKYPHGGFYVCPCAVGTVTRIEQKQELKQAKPVTFGF